MNSGALCFVVKGCGMRGIECVNSDLLCFVIRAERINLNSRTFAKSFLSCQFSCHHATAKCFLESTDVKS